MLHDPEVYPNPMEFCPERFEGRDSEMENVYDLAFGFCWRVCPGKHFPRGTLCSIFAITLATCIALPGLDEEGNEAMPKFSVIRYIKVHDAAFSELNIYLQFSSFQSE